MMDWSSIIANAFIAKTFIGLLAIVNPVGAIPVFLSLTANKTAGQRARTARNAALAVALVLSLVAWSGEAVLGFFGIGIPSFRIGGGLLILLMAVAMLHARMSPTRHTDEEADEAMSDRQDVAVVPLAIPLMAGPGAISLVIVDAHPLGWQGRTLLTLVVMMAALAAWGALRLGEPLGRVLGVTGLNITTRIMGLILAAIGVQFIAEGLKGLFPLLAGVG